MKKIGLTGGIGSGKSVVGKILSIIGFPVFDSDSQAKILMTENEGVVKKVTAVFGSSAYKDGQLNRPFLAEKIFNDPDLKEKLNQIVHPAVRETFENWCQNQNSPIVFNEAAILFETGGHKNFDAMILVVADEHTRIKRVRERDDVSEKQVRDRISNQWLDEKKSKYADFIISNNPNDLLVPQVEKILSQLHSSK